MAIETAAAFDDLTRSGELNLLTYQGPYDLPNLIRTARTVSAVDYLQVDRVRMKLIRDMAHLFETVDLLVMPHNLGPNASVANLIGLPCVVVPHGNGTGLTFIGNLYDEARMLETAKAYQDATPYVEHPPLFKD
jgi:Asp-tRNA(Asn)/Glu-tRNA(Gln) amidotransferase A subunit family amidase